MRPDDSFLAPGGTGRRAPPISGHGPPRRAAFSLCPQLLLS